MEKTTVNAAKVLVAAGIPEVNVVRGSATPILRTARHDPEIHGESGLEGTELLPASNSADVVARLAQWGGQKAAVQMAQTILASTDQVYMPM